MKKIIILFIAFFFISKSQAQVSGFMGKKFSVIYSPGINFPNLSLIESDFRSVSPSLVLSNALKFEYIFMPHMAVGVRYKFAFNSENNSTIYSNYGGFTEKHTFNSHIFGGYIKLYKPKLLAPLGPYFSTGLHLQNLSLKYNLLKLLQCYTHFADL